MSGKNPKRNYYSPPFYDKRRTDKSPIRRERMLTRTLIVIGILALVAFSFIGCADRGEEEYDILIINGKIIDGSGKPAFEGDIGIKGDSIAAIGKLKGQSAAKTLDVQGMVISPGFIDMHTHCGPGLSDPDTNSNLNYLKQGVTTVLTGPDGGGTFKIAKTKARWDEQGIGTNALMLVGQGAVRRAVMRQEQRAPTEEEMAEMKALIRQAMEEGAWGMSNGLQYIPDRYSETEEVIELARVVSEFDGIYHTHQRSEEDKVVEATEETIQISREARVRTDLTHIKASGKSNWGFMKEVVMLIDEARSQGAPVYADMYPYNMASVGTNSRNFNIPNDLLSKLRHEDSDRMEFADRLAKALTDPEKRARIKKLTVEGGPDKANFAALFGWDAIAIVSAKTNTHLIGKTYADLAQEQNKDAFDVAADLYIEEKENVYTSIGTMSEEDMKIVMSQDWLMFCSDGYTFPPSELTSETPRPAHPRSYGSFPRVLRKYVREENVLTLEEAIKKMTSLPASFLGIRDRGLLKEGYKADIVVLNPETVTDSATYIDPHRYSSGIAHVIVNGKISIEDSEFNAALNGRVLLSTKDKKR
jgi:N-acyl-D-aspartate/D-glutamate deacylase